MKYGLVKLTMVLCYALGTALLLLTIVSLFTADGRALALLLGAVSLLTLGQLSSLLMDIEANTRKTHELLSRRLSRLNAAPSQQSSDVA